MTTYDNLVDTDRGIVGRESFVGDGSSFGEEREKLSWTFIAAVHEAAQE